MKFLSGLSGFRMLGYLFHSLFHPSNQWGMTWKFAMDAWRIARSGLFDGAWYLERNQDVAEANINPLIHYMRHGASEGRDPNPLFDSDWYTGQNPEQARIGVNPLIHYIRYGTDRHQNPCTFFDADWYIARNEDVKKLGMHPLLHYLKIGAPEGRRMSPYESALHRWIEGDKREGTPKLLMIDHLYPRPDQDSGSIDCVNYIKIFQEFGYQVFFSSDKEYNSMPEEYDVLEKSGVLCLNPSDYLTIEKFIESEIEGFSAVLLSRVFSGGRFYELIRKICPQIKIIFNAVDLHSVREKREAEINNNPDKLRRAWKTAERERFLSGQCDATIVVSEYEEKRLSSQITGAHIVHVPLMREYSLRENGYSERNGICFIGDYRHTPNVDALTCFLDRTWPLILEKLPACKFYIIGYGLPENLRNRCDPDVEILGHVPDLKFWLNRARLSVAPLRYGAGAKGKVVTSLANGLPCVATSIAAEGLGLVKDRHITIGDSPIEFADRVVQLYRDKDRWTKISDEGIAFCAETFSRDSGRKKMAALFHALGLPVSDEKRI